MYSTVLLLLPVLALANPIKRDDTPQITIIDAQTSGNGCPQGTVSTSLSPDGTVVTFGFDSFQAYIGPTAAQADKSKACQIHLNLKYPTGFQYAVVDAIYHGYARLDTGVTATFLSTYFFSQNAAQTTTTRSSISGGGTWTAGNVYTKEDQVQSTATIWSPCGDTGILNVNNRIALTGSGSGEISDDDATVSLTHQLHVAWQKCTTGGSTGGGTWGVGSAGSSEVSAREAEAEPQDTTVIGPGGTTLTPGGSDPGSGDNWTIGPGGSVVINPREAEAEPEAEAQDPGFGIGPGGSTIIPGGNPPPGDGSSWTIGPGTVVITHPPKE